MMLLSTIKLVSVNPYVHLQASQVSRLKRNWHGPMPVRFKINGVNKLWRVNLMPIGDGTFRLYLNGEIRKEADIGVGDMVRMGVWFDDEYRGGPRHPMPPRLRAELVRNRVAKERWDSLTPSLQKEMLRYFARLKSPEARQNNLERAVHVLSGNRGRFLGREWNGAGEGDSRSNNQSEIKSRSEDKPLDATKKLQLTAGTPVFLVDPPKGFDPGAPTSNNVAGAAILAFAANSVKLKSNARPAIDAAKDDRLSWIAYPKGGKLGTDLNRDKLVKLMKPFGIDSVRLVSLDDTWAAIRFRPIRAR